MDKPEAMIIKNAIECLRLWREASVHHPATFKRIMIEGAAPRAVIRKLRMDLDMIERIL